MDKQTYSLGGARGLDYVVRRTVRTGPTPETFQVPDELRQSRIITRNVTTPLENVLFLNRDPMSDPIVPMGILGHDSEGLVDSGSNCTMVDETEMPYIDQKPYQLGGAKITTITGEDMGLTQVYKDLEMNIGIRKFKVNAIIGHDMNPKVLLGQDAMAAGEFTVDIKNRLLIDLKPKKKSSETQTIAERTDTNEDGPWETDDQPSHHLNRIRVDEISSLHIRTLTLHPFQTKAIPTPTNIVCPDSILIRRVTQDKGPVWITNPT